MRRRRVERPIDAHLLYREDWEGVFASNIFGGRLLEVLEEVLYASRTGSWAMIAAMNGFSVRVEADECES